MDKNQNNPESSLKKMSLY